MSTTTFSFEGPEKRLLLVFGAHRTGATSLRHMHTAAMRNVLEAASCTVLSVKRTSSVDAYLLSESSLFVGDRTLMLKTCGTTTLLRALPLLLDVARDLALFPIVVQYSRVHFTFPERQPWPHDAYGNEVTFLDATLDGHGMPLALGGSDWQVYLSRPRAALIDFKLHTLEVFMFDLHDKSMSHFVGGNDAMQTTFGSGVGALLPDDAIIDAYSFTPCGYSLNALHDDAYTTVHISPEPQASYVSYECTADNTCLADKVVAIVKTFRPRRFTVSFIGTDNCSAVQEYPDAPIDWLKMTKLLGGTFRATTAPVLLEASPGIWTAVATYKETQHVPLITSIPAELSPHDPMTKALSNLNIHRVPRNSLAKARAAVDTIERIENPLLIVDVHELRQRADRVRAALPPNLTTRYSVRCNSDRGVLGVLNVLGWTFEAVSINEVRLLRELGVERSRIVFSSPLITQVVNSALNDIGTVVLFSVPEEEVANAIQSAGNGVELRVSCDGDDDAAAICERILLTIGRIDSFALDADSDIYEMTDVERMNALEMGLHGIRMLCEELPNEIVDDLTVHIGELLLVMNDWDELHFDTLINVTKHFGKVTLDLGQWVVGASTSLVVSVIGMRVRNIGVNTVQESEVGIRDAEQELQYYLNDGVYGAFSSIIMGRYKLAPPEVLSKSCVETEAPCADSDDRTSVKSMELLLSTLFGPTCDALDKVWSGALPRLDVGDLLLFENMGAYSVSAVSAFNGFAKYFHTVYVTSENASDTVDFSSDLGSE